MRSLLFAAFLSLLPVAPVGCKSQPDDVTGNGIPEGCPTSGESLELHTPPGNLFLKDVRFFTSVGKSPMVTSPEGTVFAVVRIVFEPRMVPTPVATTSSLDEGPQPPMQPGPQSGKPPAAPVPSRTQATDQRQPTGLEQAGKGKGTQDAGRPAMPDVVVPPELRLADASGEILPLNEEAMEAYKAMVAADAGAKTLPTEFTLIWTLDPRTALGGIFLLTQEKGPDGSPQRFCLGRHKIQTGD